MRTPTRKVLAASALAATTVALSAVPTSADPLTYTVQNGGDITGINSGSILAFGNTNGWTLECTASTVAGSMPSGTGLTGTGIASLTSASFSSPGEVSDWCTENGTFPSEVTALDAIPATPGLDWAFDATGKAGADTTDGRLTNVLLNLHITGWFECDLIVGGPGPNGSGANLEATYTNPASGSSGWLDVPLQEVGSLTVLSTSGINCGIMYTLGEKVSIAMRYDVVTTPPAAGFPTID